MIEFRDLYKSFGENQVLQGVSLEVETGEVLFIVGTSGVGKSVLVKHLVGLLRPDSGRIFLDGEEVTALSERDFYPVRLKCGYVFQHSTLFDSMTILDNVALPLRKHRRLGMEKARRLAMEKLSLVDMEPLAGRFPMEVGAGLQKRAAISRALTLDPAYLIFDEPTTGLDPPSARQVDRLIRRLADTTAVTAIVVSHDLASILTVADRIVMLHEGRIRLDGDPVLFREAGDPVVRQFMDGVADGPIEI